MSTTLKVWHTIISTTLEVRKLLDNALTPKGGETTVIGTFHPPITPAVRTRLRGELLTKLNELRASLHLVLTDADVALVIYPLIIHIDELVMRRLSKQEQTQWSLLQKELFDIIDGGEAFFDFATERLSKPDTPPIVYQVLYFCLVDGFIGRYASEPARIDQFKQLLNEKIPLPPLPTASGKRRRGKEESDGEETAPPLRARWFYLSALLAIMVLVGLTAVFTNL